MKRFLLLKTICLLYALSQQVVAQKPATGEKYYRDLFSDTWVATDALGRTMPGVAMAGPLKKDHRRVVSVFYITWHTDDKASLKSPYSGDVTKVLAADTNARLDAKNPQWKEHSYHWGEPEMGYFLSKDEFVIRKDMSMLKIGRAHV